MDGKFNPPPINVVGLPATQYTMPVNSAAVDVRSIIQNVAVRGLEAQSKDSYFVVRESALRRWRTSLAKIVQQKFPWHEFTLAIGTLALGGYFGGLSAPLVFGTFFHWLLHTALPCIGFGCLIIYFFMRRSAIVDVVSIVKDVVSEIPDPDKPE